MLLLGLRQIILKSLLLSLELIGAALAGAVVLVSLLAWRLSEGPLKLEAVQPYLVSALSQAVAPLRVSISETGLDWADARNGLGFTARGIHLINAEGQTVATLPELEIGLSLPALLIGRPAPNLIRLTGLQLRVIRTAEGKVQFSLADNPAGETSTSGEINIFPTLLEALSHPINSTSPLGALRRVEINAARMEVVDYQYGVRWQAPQADFQLERDRAGMRGALRLEVAMGTEKPTLDGGFLMEQKQGDIRFDLHLDKFNPSGLAAWSTAFGDLGRINVPFSGRLAGRWAGTGGISDLHFDLSLGAGQVTAQTNQPPLAVKYAQLVGSINRAKHRLEVQNLYADFGGTKLVGSAVATRDGNDVILNVASGIDNMPASELPRYWLPNWAPGAHDWVTHNITDGLVPKAQAQLRLAIPLDQPDAVRPVALDGTMLMQGLTVNYFRPLPPATEAFGNAHFDLNGFHITVDKAKVGALSIDKAQVDLLGLNDHSDRADIAVTVNGKLADQLLLLDNEPLRYPHRLKIDAAKAGGTALTQAHFLFPLFKDLPIEDVAIAAISKAENVALPNLVMDQDLSDATLDLTLDGGGMKIVGDGKLGTAKATFQWEESFLDKVSPGTKISFKGTMNEEARKGFHVAWPEVIGANVGVEGTYIKNRGQAAQLDANLDLTPASLTLPWFAWHKSTGEKAQGKVSVLIDKNQVDSVPSFRMSGGGASLRGSVDFANGSRWSTVHLDAITVPGSDLKGIVENHSPENGLALNFTGAAADIRSMFADETDESAAPEKPPEKALEKPAPPPTPTALVPLDIRFDIGRVVTGPERALSGAKGHIVRNTKGWTHLEIDGKVGQNATPIVVRLVPSPTGRSLAMRTNDAGAMLATLGLMKNIQGGVLEASGEGAGNGPVNANAILRDFRYLQPETLKKIAAAAQPKGAEALARDEGVAFSRLKAQFAYNGDSVDVQDARMTGDLMGMTMAGKVNLLAGQIDLSGTIVPLYGINSLVGGIPVLGWILTGGEGSGIFAATYTVRGPLRNPETSVNPLSILAPGFLRELFFVDRHG